MSNNTSEKYNLIGLDQMEASRVRRRLHKWTRTDEETIRPLVAGLQRSGCLQDCRINEPRWETNVYPLYYWASHKQGRKKPYDHVFELVLNRKAAKNEALRTYVKQMVNSEIDILVEDHHYFIFIEAKEVAPGRKTIFQDRGGLRQLIRQYVQGQVLARLVGKTFCIATIGANGAQPSVLEHFSRAEFELLRSVSEGVQPIKVIDLCWPNTAAAAQLSG